MRHRNNYNAQEVLPPWVRWLLIVVLAIFVLVPVGYMLLLSVTPDIEVNGAHFLPSHWAFENYAQMWSTINLAQGLFNSVLISLVASTIAVILAVGAAYVITRFHFRGRVAYLYSLIGLQAIPSIMLLLPLFVLFVSLQSFLQVKLVGSYTGVIITYLTFSLPFATWLLVTYLANIPLDVEEAAMIDGATRLQTLWRIIVPLALPGLVVALVFSFLTGWNDVLFASVLTSPETQTVGVQLQAFSAAQEGGALPLYGQLMSAALMSGLPVVILYLIFQKYLIGGLTAGSVKG
ncbi:ABC transporter permease [Ktedonobacter sp. SOSP1-85]|uniref:carbohydrate ABC transporter permease n=1 Tax=Ktedonobacter sp. SOSP1-85 TaxID=2778367 RepID=UPI0019152695|nr:carbohydrate ABC transporter permease [Ktedonobacter sp. SOSP1-85]GHO78853.1 ABC transporter permease [Ktedonobacter sp. SOSP1-85]